MKPTTSARDSFRYLRSICRDFSERMTLGDAINNGWTAEAITEHAETERRKQHPRTSKEAIYRWAIRHAASTTYVTAEQRAVLRTEIEAVERDSEARRAIKATKENRPAVPREFAVLSAACRNMDDCDSLASTIEHGWNASDLLKIAEGWGRGVDGKPTQSALRLAFTTVGPIPGHHIFLRESQRT